MSIERTIVFSTKHQMTIKDRVTPDIDKDPVFMALFEQVLPYTMTSKEALFALYTSVNYVLDREIPGDLVECGVWRGGSSLLAALIMKAQKSAIVSYICMTRFRVCQPPPNLMWTNVEIRL